MATTAEARANLALAETVRLARAELKRRVSAGELTIRDVLKVHEVPGIDTLEDVDREVRRMTVAALLDAQHRWGPFRTAKLLASLGIGEHVQVGALTCRQRRLVVAALDDGLAQTDAVHAEALRDDAERDRLRALGPLGVECPSCRSRVGDVCSTYDPVHDRWHEPPTHPKRYDAAGIKRP